MGGIAKYYADKFDSSKDALTMSRPAKRDTSKVTVTPENDSFAGWHSFRIDATNFRNTIATPDRTKERGDSPRREVRDERALGRYLELSDAQSVRSAAHELGDLATTLTDGAAFTMRDPCFLLFFLTGFVSTYKQCGMPGGNLGECRLLKECKPLYELNRKRGKTEHELLYLRQSQCGTTSSFQILFCCPLEPLWGNFKDFKPVLFNEIINYDTVLKEKVSTNDKKPNTNSDIDFRNTNEERNDTTTRPKENPSAAITECGKDYSNPNRIIGGGPTAIDQYPWLVLLEYENLTTLCGGSLITTRYVLTAAHCIRRAVPPKFARLAEYNTTSFPTDYVEVDGGGMDEITVDRVPIEKSIAHPNYSRAHLHHDIGLSKLSRDAELGDFIRLICLPTEDFMRGFREPMNFTVAGWGNDGVKSSEVKKHVKVPYVETQKCQMFYALRRITDGQICAGGNLNEDSCSGDSGGPLMYESGTTFVAVGVVSYGPIQCGTEHVPAVYTYVYSYLDWLRENMD
ncbi:unnamed protein product, partial [Iphiclides podalirius]